MYQEISSNKRKTVILIALFAVVIIVLGWVFGEYYGNPSVGIIGAAMLATFMTLLGFFKGDAISLAASGAKKIEKRDY